ncbi:conserved membrane hypothetical protein [Gammaproteobacteria bacterium]
MLVILFSIIFFSLEIFPKTDLFLDDGYYHFTIARLIGEGRLWIDISWLPYTILGAHGPDHQWLFHVLLAPFTWIPDNYLAIRIAIIFTGALVPIILFLILEKCKVPFPSLFALLSIFGGIGIPLRFEMLRAQNLSVLFSVLFIYFVIRRSYVSMAILTYLFFNAYHGAIITVPIIFIAIFVKYIKHHVLEKELLLYFFAAFGLAIIINPWFPRNIDYLLIHLFSKSDRALTQSIGTEWLPYPLSDFSKNIYPVNFAIFFAAGYFLFVVGKVRHYFREMSEEVLVFILLTLVVLGGTLHSNRFVEYYAPFAAISSGLLMRDAIGFYSRNDHSNSAKTTMLRYARKAWYLLTIFSLLVVGIVNISSYKKMDGYHVENYQPLAKFLHEQVKNGSIIFNTSWADFVFLMWQTTDYRMVNGLDVHFLADADQERFLLWYKTIYRYDFTSPTLIQDLRDKFSTNWIMVHAADATLAQYLLRQSGVTLRFHYPYGWLFYIDE